MSSPGIEWREVHHEPRTSDYTWHGLSISFELTRRGNNIPLDSSVSFVELHVSLTLTLILLLYQRARYLTTVLSSFRLLLLSVASLSFDHA